MGKFNASRLGITVGRYVTIFSASCMLVTIGCSGAGASSGVDYLEGGTLTITKASGDTFTATSDTVIEQGDTLSTDSETQVWITLKEDLKVYLGNDTEAKIELLDEPTEDVTVAQSGGGQARRATNVRLNSGTLWSSLSRAGNQYAVTTTTTVAGARGTAFSSVKFADGGELFCTCRGEISVESNGQRMDLIRGMGTTIYDGVMSEKGNDLDRLKEGTDPRYESCYACHERGKGTLIGFLKETGEY